MTESRFKRRIFTLLLFAKLIAVLTLWFEWTTSGFTTSEMAATIALILPLFTTYTAVIFKEFSESPFEEEVDLAKPTKPPRKVKKILVRAAHILIPLYGLIIALFITWKPSGILSFSNMQAAIAGVESILGVYVGQLVFVLFKKSET